MTCGPSGRCLPAASSATRACSTCSKSPRFFKRESPGRLQIEICGGGEALEELKRAIADQGLAEDV